MKTISITPVIFASACLLFLSCKKNTDTPSTPTTTANLMFVNGCAGPTFMNVSVNGTILAGASDLNFLTNSGYQVFTSGAAMNLEISVFSVPDSSSSNSNGSFSPGIYYSFFTGGSLTNTTFVESIDDLSAPATGMAKVRFVNLSVDSLNLNCYIGNQKVDSNVSFGIVSQFVSVSATNETVLLQDPSRLTDSAMLSGQSFLAGKIYTIMFTGTQSGTHTNKPTLTVIDN